MNTLFVIMAILLVHSVWGIGVGPASTKIDFEPNLTRQYSITVYNTEHKSFEATLELTGELEKFLLLESKAVSFTEEDNQKSIFFNVSFPRDIPPGSYTGQIVITEKPLDIPGTIIASLGVTHEISLEVPTHGKYIKESIEEKNKSIHISIKNIGLKEIEKLEVFNKIYDSTKEFPYYHSKNNFLSDEVFNFSLVLTQPIGIYTHKVSIKYDELTKNITKTLIIGEIQILITDLKIKDFNLGEIAAIDVSLSSNWNQDLNVYAEIDVFDQEELIDTIKGPTLTINNMKTTTLFWDTKTLAEGEYRLVVKVFHNNKVISEKEYSTKLTEEKAVIRKEVKLYPIIILSITILFFGLVILFLKIKRRKKT